ncbi:hypothetical protein PVL29_022313 [Vitis rotundifolia]|uniref:COBRA C-terminal domain-containing protein n=1 Tax=Vitis rotundifolia TaxID=103349 RepID=A0AA39DCI1_VITRO|nr:hypothetical protein PVL29_022313 [Vitis rotundifolia]
MEFNGVAYSIVSAVFFSMVLSPAVAYDPLDPNGNITIKWDVMSWTPDGYVAVVTMSNFQMYRQIMSPGWTLGWTWAKKEVIWSMVGAQATEQGDCSKFKGNIPHCCKRNPTVVDLLPGVPYNQQIANCCKGGVVASWGQDSSAAVSSFQLTVGLSGTSNKTVRLPKNFTLLGPGPGYTCGQAITVPSSIFLSSDGRRQTQALMTWNVTCTYSQMVVSKYPSCCVSFSSFYNSTITPCTSCACGCQNKNNCIMSDTKIESVVGLHTPTEDNMPLLQCTQHNCPIRVHWHVKVNYQEYWRVKITITNFNYRMNYTQWTLVAQHPNLNNITQVFSFAYKPLIPYTSINDSGMFYGIKFYNDVLMEDGPDGNVQSEMILQKDKNTFTLKEGWAFPQRIYFNGDECMMPLPDSYPLLAGSAPANQIALSTLASLVLLILLAFQAFDPGELIFVMEFNNSANRVHHTPFEGKDRCQWQDCYSFRELKHIFSVVIFFMMVSHAIAYDPLDPTGNITIKWDVVSWTPDGYVALVTMNNFQMYRHIMTPGWTLSWSWAKKEVIWSMVGAQTTEQGDCSKFKANIPHCCKKTPVVVDLLPGVPYNQQIANCCKAGVVAAWGQDPAGSVSSFQVSVGQAGTSNKTVKLPKNFTLLGPGLGYTCGPAKIVPSTIYLTPDHRRKTQAMMTWNVTCTYSQFLASKNPTCCVSFSTFYNDTMTPCPSCACGCRNKNMCISSDSKKLKGLNNPKRDNTPLLQCTHHMCPIRVHWHVKLNYKDYWRVKIAITNFNYRMNYTQWTLVAQHPNLNNVTQVFSFDYKPLVPYESISASSEEQGHIYFQAGVGIPSKVYFNGDECKLPPPDTYPFLPNSAHANPFAFWTMAAPLLLMILYTIW